MSQVITDEVEALGAAILAQSGAHALHHRVRPAWPGAALAGPVITATCAPGDNLAIHVAIDRNEIVGAILVVDASAAADHSYIDEIVATAAAANDVVGVVIDGGCCGVTALADNLYPVFSTLVTLQPATSAGGGSVGTPVTVGDVAVQPGDWIVGDADGVVLVPRANIAAIIEAGNLRFEHDQITISELKAGKTTVDLFGLDGSRID